MGYLGLGYDDAVYTATSIVAEFALATLPGANVGTQQIGQVWRTPAATTSSYILIDFGSSKAIGLIAAIATNFTSSATWQVRVSTADATGNAGDALNSGVVNAGVDPLYGKAVYTPSAPVTGRYLKISFVATGSTEIIVGRIVAMKYWKPTRNFMEGAQLLHFDRSKRFEANGGEVWFLRNNYQQGISLVLHAVTDAEKNNQLRELYRLSGVVFDILVLLDRDSTNKGRDSYFGPITQLDAFTLQIPDMTSVGLEVWERL